MDVNLRIDQLAEKHSKIYNEKSNNVSKDFVKYQLRVQSVKCDYLFQQLKNLNSVNKIDEAKFEQAINELIEEKVNYIKSKKDNSLVTALIYELLTFIFQNTTVEERPYIFRNIIETYYTVLSEKLKTLETDIGTVLPYAEYDKEIRKVVAYVKLDVICDWINNDEKKTAVEGLLLELEEYFLNPGFLREECYQILEKLRASPDSVEIKFLRYEFVPLDSKPGFLGEYFKLRLYIQRGNKEEIIYCFVKFVSNNVPDIFFYVSKFAFKKEEFIYTNFVPQLEKLGLDDISNFAAKCWFLREQEVMVLEDLHVLGYKSIPLDIIPDFEWMTLVVKTIAKFHSGSLILEEKMCKKTGTKYRIGDHYQKYLEEILFTTNETGKVQHCSVRTILNFFLDKCSDVPKRISMEQFKDSLKDAYQHLSVNFSASHSYRNVICHGDLWPTNIMYREENSKPVSGRFVDYQLIRYCPPILDITLFVYLITDKKTREKYMMDLLDIYYKELSTILSRHDIDLNDIYDKETFLRSYEELKIYGLWHAFCYGQVIFCPREVFPQENMNDFWIKDRSEAFEKGWAINEKFRVKMREYVEDMYDFYEKRNFIM